jgi:hypothetical protein
VVEGTKELVATACTPFGPICCHVVVSFGSVASAGSELALMGALKKRRSSGKLAESDAGSVADTRNTVVVDALDAADAPIVGKSELARSTAPKARESFRFRFTVPGY